jgi:NitT/TauT family transport system substrate-binding protein
MGDPGPNNGNTATMKAVMDKAGYGADKLTYVTVGAQAAILAALQKNQVQVGLLVAPFTIEARGAGLNDLGTVEKYLPNNTAAAFAGTTATLQKKAELVRNFLAAVLESTQWVAQNPTDAISLLMQSDKLTKDVATQDYNEVKDLYTKTEKIDPQGLATWIAVATKYGVMKSAIPADGLYTNDYLPSQ